MVKLRSALLLLTLAALACSRGPEAQEAAEPKTAAELAAAEPATTDTGTLAGASTPKTAPAATVDDQAVAPAAPAVRAAPPAVTGTYSWDVKVDPAQTIAARLPAPKGYARVPVADGSFAAWLRTLPVKPGRPKVHLHDGSLKGNQSAHVLVIDIDTGRRDLQQCADAVMRLRAEYLYSAGRYGDVHFNFTTGDEANYQKWRHGYRPKVRGNDVSWAQTAAGDTSYNGFRKYLDSVFTYAGTYSLSRELKSKKVEDLSVGDVFIIGGFPGHAVIVVDVAENPSTKKKLFLLAQSYMPAQDMHVLHNPEAGAQYPWFSTEFGQTLVTPEWDFDRSQLKTFGDADAPAASTAVVSAALGAADAPPGLLCLARHYGGKPHRNQDGWVLDFGDGKPLPFDDGKKKSAEQRLTQADLEDMLAAPYPAGTPLPTSRPTSDPGRVRHDGLLRHAYGDDRDAVRQALVAVDFVGHRVMIHKKAAPALRRVAKRLEKIVQDDAEARAYLSSLGGTFAWRVIAGTSRLSAHSFGIALDLNPQRAAYWRWSATYDGRYHAGIVASFEAEHFIWGGRWKHFDSMHFEYRPELFDAACRL